MCLMSVRKAIPAQGAKFAHMHHYVVPHSAHRPPLLSPLPSRSVALTLFNLPCREPTLTTRTNHFSGCLDYIWLSKQHWKVQATLEMPYAEPAGEPGPPDRVAVEEFEACPNRLQPSDHIAVGCEAVLLPAAGSGT